jgi:hypothetical protein
MISKSLVNKFLEFGLSVVPVDSKKVPTQGSWKKYQSVLIQDWELGCFDNPNAVGIAIVAGRVSGGLECIDIDCKYDLHGDLYEKYIAEIPKELLDKLVIQKTASNGYHIIYRSDKIEGNKKLASRHTTPEEKEIKKNEKVKVLLETRGEGGYFLVDPSKGYKVIQGKFSSIQKISDKERDFLIETAMTFNEYVSEQYVPKEVSQSKKYYQISPFEDFDNRCDVVSLLEQHGWSMARQFGNKYYMKREGTENRWSAEYDRNKNWFTVFSTSTEFESLKAYRPYAIYAVLNNITDWSEVSKKLISEGYGIKSENYTKPKKPKNIQFEEVTEEEDDGDVSFLTSWSDTRKDIEDFVEGKIPMGLKTGFWRLDEYFRFKRGNFVVVNGHDNAGKTTIILYFAMISAVKHGWKWCIYSTENSAMSIMRTLIQFYLKTPIKETTEAQRNEAQQFIEKHFVNITIEQASTYQDLKKLFTKVKRYFNFDGMLIDPYNSLDSSKAENSHTFDYAVVNDMKIWGRVNDVSIYVNTHAITSALRRLDDEGYVMAPNKGDAEGGTKFSSKADEWITIHRIANHEDERVRRITEIHIRKVKETDTGGKQTSNSQPFKLVWENKGSVFYDAEDALCTHPFLQDQNNLDFEDILNEPPF